MGATPGQVGTAKSSVEGGLTVANTVLPLVFLITFVLHFQPNQTSGDFPAEATPLNTLSTPSSLLLPGLSSSSPTAGSGPGKRPSWTEHPPPPGREAQGPLLWAPEHPRQELITCCGSHAILPPSCPLSPSVSLSLASATCGHLRSENATWRI